jgi:hypothetical protein
MQPQLAVMVSRTAALDAARAADHLIVLPTPMPD